MSPVHSCKIRTALLHGSESIRSSATDLVPSAQTIGSVDADLDLTTRTTSYAARLEPLGVLPCLAAVRSARVGAAEKPVLAWRVTSTITVRSPRLSCTSRTAFLTRLSTRETSQPSSGTSLCRVDTLSPMTLRQGIRRVGFLFCSSFELLRAVGQRLDRMALSIEINSPNIKTCRTVSLRYVVVIQFISPPMQ